MKTHTQKIKKNRFVVMAVSSFHNLLQNGNLKCSHEKKNKKKTTSIKSVLNNFGRLEHNLYNYINY